MTKSRMLLLAGVSALAMLASAAEANGETSTTPGKFSFIAPSSGEYSLEALGASGGDGRQGIAGGLGAEVSGDVSLTAGEDLTLFVGGRGQSTGVGGGGGGSFIFLGKSLLAVAAGGGGAGFYADGGSGRATTSGGGTGGGTDGGAGGMNGNGGGGATLVSGGNGGGGAGVNAGAAGYGGAGAGDLHGSGAFFPDGGAGAIVGRDGGFGGGGGGGLQGGGGGGGYSGGGGGAGGGYGGGGGGGGSFVAISLSQVAISGGVNSGNGLIMITALSASAVPEPSTWGMTHAGFAGLGWLATWRRRKTSPAWRRRPPVFKRAGRGIVI